MGSKKIMNPGTEILSKIRDKAESMTIKEYEELFENSQNLDVVNIEIVQSLFLKPQRNSEHRVVNLGTKKRATL
ncbi:hypothetical protein QUF72_01685 [Desulfobacterales bacterium HSG2]|nr:hypothetical protein [Desulfobacterales bacterium HSG2]